MVDDSVFPPYLNSLLGFRLISVCVCVYTIVVELKSLLAEYIGMIIKAFTIVDSIWMMIVLKTFYFFSMKNTVVYYRQDAVLIFNYL